MIDATMTEIPIRLMTYNVMRGRYNCYEERLKADKDFRRSANVTFFNSRADFVRANLATMADHIRQYDPDIIALQEVQESITSMSISHEISTASYLAQQLGMTFIFSPTLFDYEVYMQYGTAILLNHHKYRLISVEIVYLPVGLEPRNSPCLTIQSRHQNFTFRACSVHLDHDATDDRIRLQQTNKFVYWLTRRPNHPTILMGDFNADRNSTSLRNLYGYFFDDDSSDNFRPTWSECGEILKDKLDYILFDRQSRWSIKSYLHGLNMKQLYSTIEMTMLSDHVPLFAEVVLST